MEDQSRALFAKLEEFLFANEVCTQEGSIKQIPTGAADWLKFTSGLESSSKGTTRLHSWKVVELEIEILSSHIFSDPSLLHPLVSLARSGKSLILFENERRAIPRRWSRSVIR